MIGKVVAVVQNRSGFEELAMYDVKFEFGTFTVYSTQLTASPKSQTETG